jgi:allantoin racemase
MYIDKMRSTCARYFSGKKILYLNPGGTASFDAPIHNFLTAHKQTDTEIHVCSLIPKGRPRHLSTLALEGAVIKDILEVTRYAEKSNYDALIIGCFGDPGIREARELANKIVITGPLESSCFFAMSYANNFSMLIGKYSWMSIITPEIERLGVANKIKSIRDIQMHALDYAKDRKEMEKRLHDQAKLAVHEDKAECIILGCTLNFSTFESIQKELGVPVIDPVLAAFKHAEMLAECKKRFCWHVSSHGTMTPPADEDLQIQGVLGQDVIGNMIK